MSIQNSLKRNPRRRKFLLAGLSLLIAIYIAVCADFYFRQEWYILEPNVVPPGKQLNLKEVRFEPIVKGQNGGRAEIYYRKYVTTATPRNEIVFYLHGNKGNMDLCEFQIVFLLELGYDVWTMDYRRYGDSTGEPSEAAFKDDALDVYELITKELPEVPIIIWGRSFGSGVAASVAASVAAAKTVKKPKMVVLETPYWSLVDLVRQKHPYLPPGIFRYELPIHEFLKSANCPIHLIHGTQDEKIPFNSSERLKVQCESKGNSITGHSIMCGKHDLRDLIEFKEIASKILK